MHEILFLLGAMIIFYFLMILVAIKIKEKKGKQICPVCATVSLTWMALLVLHGLEIMEIDHLLLAVLLGASVCGMMYLVDKKIENAAKKAVWKIGSIVLGTFLAWGVVSHQRKEVLLLVVVSYLGLVYFSLRNNIRKKTGGMETEGENKDSKDSPHEQWLKKLENCCMVFPPNK